MARLAGMTPEWVTAAGESDRLSRAILRPGVPEPAGNDSFVEGEIMQMGPYARVERRFFGSRFMEALE